MLVRTLKTSFFLSLLLLLTTALSAQTPFWTESFETDGNGTRYTTSTPEFTDNSGDFFIRTDGSDITGTYDIGTPDGSFFFAGQDLDGEGASSTLTVTFAGIDITGFTNLSFSGLFAEDDASNGDEDWDAADIAFVEVSIDGGAWTKVMQFAANGGTNTEPGLDTDFDGVQDGTSLTDVLTKFSAPVTGTGTSLDIRITMTLNSGDEDIAFDLLQLSGDAGSTGPVTTTALIMESFETDGNNTRYTASEVCTDNSGDFFTRTDGSDISSSYNVSGQDGDFFWAGMDTDGAPCASDIETLTFSAVDISGFTNLQFSGLFAEDDDGGNQDWDGNSLVYVEYSMDGGSNWTKILQFAAAGGTNTEPLQDTDFDGTGDGPALTDEFAEFTAAISETSGMLTLRITAENLDAGDEDIAFDLIKVTGEAPAGCTDTDAPTAVCVTDPVMLYLDENGAATLNPADLDNGSSDDCSLASQLMFSADQTEFACGDLGANTITMTVMDATEKSAQCTATVTVVDTVSPTIFAETATVELSNGMGSLSISDLDGAGTDNCGVASSSLSKSTFNCDDVSEVALPVASDLFFSEYIEGSGNNKYLEIFNGTGASVDLSMYEVQIYNNGGTSPNSTFALSGTLADGEVLVLANSSASIYNGTATVANVTGFNGDDALALLKDGVMVDVFGVIGEDPGSQWNVDGVETQNQTLRRVSTVSSGIVPSAGFAELSAQWEEFPIDDASGLGSHSLSAVATTVPVVVTLTDASGNSSSKTIQVLVTDPSGSCDLPAAPMDFYVNGDTAFFPSLRWADMSEDEDGFNIYRSLDGGASFSMIDQVPADQTYYYDLLASGSATYYVTAYNDKGESAASNEDSYTFQPISELDLNFVCYDAGSDLLTWSVSSPNSQWVPFIWAQWWSAQRDTVYAAPNATVYFQTENNPQNPSTFGDDNITGIWYWGTNFGNLFDEVFTIPLTMNCNGARLADMIRAPKVRRDMSGLRVDIQAAQNEYLAAQLEVGPNPATDYLLIRTQGVDQVATFTMMNGTGQVVRQQAGNLAQPQKLDLSGLSQGVYFLHIQAGGARYSQQIVIE